MTSLLHNGNIPEEKLIYSEDDTFRILRRTSLKDMQPILEDAQEMYNIGIDGYTFKEVLEFYGWTVPEYREAMAKDVKRR